MPEWKVIIFKKVSLRRPSVLKYLLGIINPNVVICQFYKKIKLKLFYNCYVYKNDIILFWYLCDLINIYNCYINIEPLWLKMFLKRSLWKDNFLNEKRYFGH
jgi:hypothetical protein